MTVQKITTDITPLEEIEKINEIIDNLGLGGGGSSYTDENLCSNVVHTQGYNNGSGYIIITKTMPTFTINPTPSDAIVTLTAGSFEQIGNSITVSAGTNVSYTVSKDGYQTTSGNINVVNDMDINIILQGEIPSGTVLFESGVPGTYSINVEANCTIHLDMCGAGGRGNKLLGRKHNGGSAGYIYGETKLEKGTYTIIVGAANSGLSSFNENIAYGGGNADGMHGGTGGTTSVVSLGLIGSNGASDSTTSRILSYGGGGHGEANGQSGYCKIVTV